MRDVALRPGATNPSDPILAPSLPETGRNIFMKPGWVVANDPVLVAVRYYPGQLEVEVEPPTPDPDPPFAARPSYRQSPRRYGFIRTERYGFTRRKIR